MSQNAAHQQPLVFAGHSNFITALADYDMSAFLRPDSTPSTPPDASLAYNASLYGGLFEVFAPPVTPPALHRSATGMQIDLPPRLERSYALEKTLDGIQALQRLQRRYPDRVRLVRSVEEIREALHAHTFATVLHLADADALDADLETLYTFYQLGVRSMALTWSRENIFASGVPYQIPGSPDMGPGLTEAGKRLVKTCNELGIIIDLAHLNEAGFWDVAKLSNAPLVVSHGAAHTLSPTSRALTDKQIEAIAASHGLIGISLEGVTPSAAGIIGDMLSQIHYILKITGPAGVALGSDLFQKADATILLPELIQALYDFGYDQSTIDQITHVNWMRILKTTWH